MKTDFSEVKNLAKTTYSDLCLEEFHMYLNPWMFEHVELNLLTSTLIPGPPTGVTSQKILFYSKSTVILNKKMVKCKLNSMLAFLFRGSERLHGTVWQSCYLQFKERP